MRTGATHDFTAASAIAFRAIRVALEISVRNSARFHLRESMSKWFASLLGSHTVSGSLVHS